MNLILETHSLVFRDMITYPDMQIPDGQNTFLTGPSGSGKSTLLRLFNGTLTPSGGDIFFNARSIAKMDTIELRKDVLLVGQSVFLFDTTVRDNFCKFYEYRNLPVPADDYIQKLLRICCADFPLDKSVVTMSGGERHRVFIAICLSFMPKVIMLDEPTSALDGDTAAKLLQSVLAFSKENGMTIIVVCHDTALTNCFSENKIMIGGQANE